MSRLPPGEAERRRKARVARSFSPLGYRHYDASDGYGSEREWQEAAERLAAGKGAYRIPEGETADGPDEPRRRRVRITPDMVTLDLEEMPAHVDGLKAAFRRSCHRTHPDHEGGTATAFKAVMSAYERLVRSY